MLLYFLVLYCAFLCLCSGVKLNNAKAQEAPIEDAIPLENAPVEGDEDAAARYRTESEEASVDRAIPLENVPIEGDEDAAARYRSKFYTKTYLFCNKTISKLKSSLLKTNG
ncbi:uncharacterized protein LOC136042525 isoform X2 [Artemia franciscana]|uniref:uncharacterized protein LOC136042525 isoform X2 n=1 Tax=Artemia franciscana TaxID=6661 RepID=UPI0032DA2CC8